MRRHRIHLMVLVAVVLSLGVVPAPAPDPVVIYLVRHAEKATDHPSDPSLTPEGEERARNLASMLRGAGVTHLHTTDFKRTRATVQPLAETFGLTVATYNPQDLWGFAETLRDTPGVHVVAGHSNTTPELVHYLGGEPGLTIDDGEYERLYQLIIYPDQPTETTLLHVPPYTERIVPKPIAWQREHITDRSDTYRMTFRGQEVGTSTWSTTVTDEAVQVHEKTVLANFGVDADIWVTLSPETLLPRRMEMSGTMFQQPSEIELQWTGEQVQGTSTIARAPFKPQGEMAIDQSLSEGTMERSSALFLAAAIPFSEEPLAFQWFNGYDAEVRTITVQQTGEANVSVPAGTFDTYRVELRGGAPSQVVYISKTVPRRIIKTEVIGMPWVYELMGE